jgi:predicted metal-dependent hydrolase
MAWDALQSHVWDALAIIFPPWDKHVMNCMRGHRDQIPDPKLLQDIKDVAVHKGLS